MRLRVLYPVLALIATSAAGCCYDLSKDGACEVAHAYCHPAVRENLVCFFGPEEPEPPDSIFVGEQSCAGTLHESTGCMALGYTTSCQRGAYFVRPGAGC